MDDRIRAMKRTGPRAIPVSVGILPAAWIKHREAMDEIVQRHPFLFGSQTQNRDYDEIGCGSYHEGTHVDKWGCVWSNVKAGMEAIVTGHPAPTRESVHTLEIPREDDDLPHGFMYLRLGDIDAHVKEAVETLGAPEGGLWIRAEIADDVPLENVEAVCCALEKYRTYYSPESNGSVNA